MPMATYTELQSITIQGNNTYFDTGIKCSGELSFKAKIAQKNNTNSYATIIGNVADNGYTSFRLRRRGNELKIGFEIGVDTGNTISYTAGSVAELEFGNCYIKNLTTGQQSVNTPKTFDENDFNVRIGNDRTETGNTTDCDYYYVKVYKNETLIADYIPVLDSANRVALYDKVSDQFIYHIGSGSVTYTEIPPRFELKVPKSASVNLYPNHTEPEDMIVVGASQTDTDNVIVIPTIHPYMDGGSVRVQVSMCQELSTSSDKGGCGFTIDDIGSYGGVKLWQRNSTGLCYSYGSTQSLQNISNTPYNTVYHLEFGNRYLKDLQTEKYYYSASTTTLTDAHKNSNLWLGMHHQFGFVKVLRKNGELIDHLVPRTINGVASLVSLVNGAVYSNDSTSIKSKNYTVSKWNNTKSIDFGGANVEFGGQSSTAAPFSANTAITSITNGNITNTNLYDMFRGCSNLKTVNVDFPNATVGGHFYSDQKLGGCFVGCSKLEGFSGNLSSLTDAGVMFLQCYSLTSMNLDLPNVTDANHIVGYCSGLTSITLNLPKVKNLTRAFISCSSLQTISANICTFDSSVKICDGCSALKQVEMIIKSANSGWTQSSFAIPTSAPCNAYKYVDDLGDGTVRLVFTDKSYIEVDAKNFELINGRYYRLLNRASHYISAQTDGDYVVELWNAGTDDTVIKGDSNTGLSVEIPAGGKWTGTISLEYDDSLSGWKITNAVEN